jgi:hypothetical protein
MGSNVDVRSDLFAVAIEGETNAIATNTRMAPSFVLLFEMRDQVAPIGDAELTDLARAMSATVMRGACPAGMPKQRHTFSGFTRRQLSQGVVLILQAALARHSRGFLALRLQGKSESRKARALSRELRCHHDLRRMASPTPRPPSEAPDSTQQVWFPNCISPLYRVVEAPGTWPGR